MQPSFGAFSPPDLALDSRPTGPQWIMDPSLVVHPSLRCARASLTFPQGDISDPGHCHSEAKLTHTGHVGHVQLEALEAVTGVALPHTHTAAVLTAVQDATLLCLKPFEASLVFWSEVREGS